MKLVWALSLVLALAVAKPYEEGGVDIAALITDDANLKALVGCLLKISSCDGVPSNFESDLNDVFKTACAKCPQAQKYIVRDFMKAVKSKFPTELEALTKKFDPEGKYTPALAVAIGFQ